MCWVPKCSLIWNVFSPDKPKVLCPVGGLVKEPFQPKAELDSLAFQVWDNNSLCIWAAQTYTGLKIQWNTATDAERQAGMWSKWWKNSKEIVIKTKSDHFNCSEISTLFGDRGSNAQDLQNNNAAAACHKYAAKQKELVSSEEEDIQACASSPVIHSPPKALEHVTDRCVLLPWCVLLFDYSNNK